MQDSDVLTPEEIIEENLDHEVRSLDTACINESDLKQPWYYDLMFVIPGIFFGVVLVKSEVISWYRIRRCFVCRLFICME